MTRSLAMLIIVVIDPARFAFTVSLLVVATNISV
jgi:hypothetical protein